MLPILVAALLFPAILCAPAVGGPTKLELFNVFNPVLNDSYFESFNPDLAFLKISSSKIGRIDKNAFDSLTNLNFLDLSGTRVQDEIDPDTFFNVRSLEKLVMRNISLHRVHLNLSNVQELILSGNLIEELESGDIVGSNVNYLDVSSNKIKYLNNSLGLLKKLTAIDISDNAIQSISPEVFKNNVNLIRIKAHLNNITSMEGLKLPRLKYLSLSLNRIGDLKTGDFEKMKFLEEIDLVYNFITYMEDPFKDLLELRYLDLSGNLIKHIDPQLFRNNLYLTRLILKANNLRNLHRFAGNFHHLSVLNLADNEISSIDDDFFLSMLNVETLDLRKNNLKHVSGLFGQLRNLKMLHLQENQIHVSGGEFKENVNLKFLNLASNGLNLGLSHFENNKKLAQLDLSSNSITNFCDANVTLEHLVKINLEQNKIVDLSCLTQNFSSLCEIDLRNNLLSCGKDFDDLMTNLAHRGCSLYEHSKKFDDVIYSIFEPHIDTSYYHCEIISLNQSFDLWNKIKNEMCPHSRPITTPKEMYINYNHASLKVNAAAEQFSGLKETILSDSKSSITDEKEKSSEEGLSEPLIQVSTSVPQSERMSWEKIDKDTDFVETLEDQDEDEAESYAWYTVPIILIALAFGLTVFNVVVFLYIRFKVWRSFNSNNEKKYTFLQNEVYKNTTEPTDSANQLGGTQLDGLNNKIFSFNRINELFFNFGLRKEKDTESVKNILIHSSNSLNT